MRPRPPFGQQEPIKIGDDGEGGLLHFVPLKKKPGGMKGYEIRQGLPGPPTHGVSDAEKAKRRKRSKAARNTRKQRTRKLEK